MKTTVNVFLIFTGLLLASCSKQTEGSYPLPITEANLKGRWQVVRQVGGIFGGNLNIEDQRWFWNFDGSGKLTYSKGGVANGTGIYEAKKYSQQEYQHILPPKTNHVLTFSDSTNTHHWYMGIQLLKTDSLVLEQPCCDMYVYYLIRK